MPQVKWNENVANSDAEKSYLCSDFIVSSVFNNNMNENKTLNCFTVTEEAVLKFLGGPLDVSKSCGPDNLPAVVPTNFAKELSKSILDLSRSFRRLGTYPGA